MHVTLDPYYGIQEKSFPTLSYLPFKYQMNSKHLQVRVNTYFKNGFSLKCSTSHTFYFFPLNDLTKETTQINKTAQAN